MEQLEELLSRINIALSLGEEPTQDEMAESNMNFTELNELLALNDMIQNDIELIKTYRNTEVTARDLLQFRYTNSYYPLLIQFDLAEFLPNISN